MAVIDRPRNTKMASNIFSVFAIVNVFHLFCISRASVELQGQAFIQTDNELRYMIDSGAASSLHNTPDPSIPDVSVVRFEPSVLDFNEQPVGMPFMEQVTVQNLDTQTSLHLLSISGSTLHFHCSFFQDKLVPPLGNTTFEVVFLARQVGNVENTLYIHSSKGSFKYQVFGVGIQNPYRIRPFLGAKVPVNSSFSPLIRMYNPHGSVLQVEEIYTSGGDLHLELPSGEREASKDLWEIPPFETKSIMKASFLGRIEHNHTAFIRIKTNKDNKQELLILPVEVEVTSAPGIYSPLEMLDFGILRTLDEPSTLRVSLVNSGSKAIQIANITVQPPNSAVHIDFRPTQVKPDVLHPTSVALISFTASRAILSKQWTGKIIIKSKNAQYKLTIPYQAHVLHGSLVYDRNKTMFYTGESRSVNVTHDFFITNTFNFTVVIYNISLHPVIKSSFTISNFSRPCLIGPQQTLPIFNLTFHPNSSMLHFTSEIYLHTNTSVFKIPVHIYNGRLKVIHHRPEIFKGQLDFGTMAVMEKRTMNFTLRNDNPVDIIVSKFYSNMERTLVSLLGVERGNGTTLSRTYNTSKADSVPLILKPYHMAVFSVELTAPDHEGTFSAEVIIDTQFEHLYMPMTLLTATGSLHLIPDRLVLSKCFPGKVSSLDVRVGSTFPHQLKLRDIMFTPNDTRFYYIPSKDKHAVLSPDQETVIGHVYFDPRRECKDDCYVTLPTHIPAGHTWLLGSALDKEVTDTDQYLFTRFRQKWDYLETSQTSIVNVTLQLDTNQVRGFLFPAQAHLHYPSLVKRPKIKFHLTQIGNTSVCEFLLENPTDIPAVVHIVPVALYPNAQTLIDTISPFLLPDIAHDYLDLDDTEMFSLRILADSSSSSQNSSPVGSGVSLAAMRRVAESSLGLRPHRNTVAFVLPSRTKIPIEVTFQPRDDIARTSLFIIRNNLTIIETVVVQGQGGLGELRFSNRKPGSQKPLTFEMTDKHLKNCDKKTHSKNVHPNFTVKRTFTMRNTGQLPLYLHGFHIGNSPCEGYGFKILDCSELELPPNASHKVDIAFTPDFTMSRIRQILTLHTSLGAPVNYSLQATIPTHMLTQCASALPRPHWEPVLYYSMVLAMGFLLICVIVAAYFEADRLFTADVMKRRSELNQMSFDKTKVFDLKAIANFKLPNDPSGKLSSNLYMSRRLPVSTSASTINGHMETGKTAPVGPHPPHRRESWFSRVLCKLPLFWLSSSGSTVTTTVVNAKQVSSPDVGKDQGSATDAAAKGIGALNSVSAASSSVASSSNDRTNGRVGLIRRLAKYVADSCTGRAVLRRIYKAIIPKRLTTKTTKSAASPTGSDRTKDLSVAAAAADLDTNSEPNQPAPAVAASSTQKKSAEQQDHSKRLLEVKPLASNNKEKISSGPPSTNSTAAVTTATQGLTDESPAGKKEAPKNQKPRKAKASELKRANKKHLENEKTDKDDSSSTTTETSSIEADEKSTISPRSQENVELSKSKKTRSKVRRKESTKSALPEDPVAPMILAPSVADDFLATSKASGKANRKTKASQHRSSSPTTAKPSSVEPPSSYVTKRDEAASKENKPKQVCLPLLTTMELPSPPASSSANRKKASKSKSPGCGQVCESNRCQKRGPSPSSASLSLWDMPRQGCDEHDALSELSAQTDAFAKTHSIPVVMSKASLLHDPLSSPPIHSSSYSSIVSNNGKVGGDHQLPPLTVVSMAPMRPGPETGLLATGGSNSEHLVINNCQSSGLMTMSGTMPPRQASSRPVAAVGATVRRPWTGGFSHSQSLPEELTAGSCQSGLAEMDMSMATGNRLYYEDPAILAGFSGLGTPTQSYMQPDGYDPYGYVQPMMTNPLDHQVTLMQRLQAERRKRVFEYEMQKQREAGAEWPGFDLPMSIPTPEPTFWEPMVSPTNPWGPPLPSSSLGVRPSGSQAGMWNLGAPPSTDSMGWIGGGNIWSSPELETKLTPPGSTDVGDEMMMHSGSSASGGGGAAGPHPIFDPFNTLEIRTGSIWNPTSTESSMAGWGFGASKPGGDNSNMK